MKDDTQTILGPPPPPPPRPGLLRRLLRRLRWARRAPVELPSSIGRYRVVRKIGEGGMGTVFEAFDEGLSRSIAIKRVKEVDETAKARFRREARAVARLSHPNVCQIFEVGEDASGPFLAMELLSGEPVSARLRRHTMSAAEVVALGSGMLAALQAIHAAGLIHRDIKPSNVYLTPYGPRLLDFGLARPMPAGVGRPSRPGHDSSAQEVGRTPLTDAQHMIGTPRYMAPEQILGGAVDGRADLFATGAVLYEALAGKPAFPGADKNEVLHATIQSTPAPLPRAFARLDPVLRRALAKMPSDRYATAQEMSEALHAAAAGAPATTTYASAGSENAAIFVGRVAELAALQERLDAALAGSGSIVFVTGERGVGKSAIVGELLRRVRASPQLITVVEGRCLEHQGPGEALQPFLDALGRLFATSRGREHAVELVKTWAPTAAVLMPAALVPDPDGSLQRQTAGATRERLIRESGDFMEAATRLYPLVILLEDVQWADAVSVDLLCHLGRRAGRQRFLILCTCRPSDLEESNSALHRGMVYLRTTGLAHELALGPLEASDVQQWLERRFPGNDFAAGLAPPLHARADGLPLFVRGLVELLAGRNDIERREDGFRLACPPGALDLEPSKDLKDLVRAHLATLPSEERELLAAASVLGKEFSSAIARGLARGDAFELEERLQRLARVHRVLESRGDEELPDGSLGTRYRFAHGLYQSVLYDDLVAPRRAGLHRRAGELLQRHLGENAPTRAVEMAEHFERGRDVLRAARFRTLAGEHAVRRFAGAEAVEHYSTAIQLVEKLPEREAQPLEAALYGRRAVARLQLARFDEAARDYQAMLEWAQSARLAAAECEALSGLCNAHFFEQRLDAMTARAQEALAAAERYGSPHHLAEARGRVAQARVLEGRLGEARSALDGVIADARASGSLAALQLGVTFRGFVHFWQGEFAAAEARMTEALVLCEERGDGFAALAARLFLGSARANLGRLSEGLADFEHALVFAARNGDRFWQPRLVSQIGWVHRELGSLAKARELDARALALARENPSPWTPEVDALLNLCVDGVRAGDPEGAAALLATIENGAGRSGWFRWMNGLRLETAATEHYAARGSLDASLERATRLSAIAVLVGARNYACTAARLMAEIALAGRGDQREAAARLETALAALQGFQAPLETWKARRALGLLRRALGDVAGAGETLVAAAADVDAIARGVDDAGLREVFLASPPVREVLAHSGRS